MNNFTNIEIWDVNLLRRSLSSHTTLLSSSYLWRNWVCLQILWKIHVLLKVQILVWTEIHGRLNIKDVLARKGISRICNSNEASTHVFLLCCFVTPLFQPLKYNVHISSKPNNCYDLWTNWSEANALVSVRILWNATIIWMFYNQTGMAGTMGYLLETLDVTLFCFISKLILYCG